jgi:transcriptional regulator with XRE-family HTH domain
MTNGQVEGIKDRIREAREQKSMTQSGLAKFMEISRTAITQWEAGLTFPSYDKCIDLSRLLGVRPEWIAFGINSPVEYRTPTSTVTLPVISFGETPEERTVTGTHYLDEKYVNDGLRLKVDENTFVYEIETEAFVPRFIPGDQLIIEGSVKKITSDGLFLIWTGLAAQIVLIASNPTKSGTVSVATTESGFTTEGRHYEAKIDELNILGRVRGRFGRAY